MKISRINPQTVVLQDLNALLCELLQAIPSAADPSGSPAAQERLYSLPSVGEPEFEADWKEYVEPDLREHFRTSLDIVSTDLRQLPAKPGRRAAKLPIATVHLEGWINALSQARLALSSRHGLTDLEMDGQPSIETPRDYAIFQIYFYGFLQECFLRELERS